MKSPSLSLPFMSQTLFSSGSLHKLIKDHPHEARFPNLKCMCIVVIGHGHWWTPCSLKWFLVGHMAVYPTSQEEGAVVVCICLSSHPTIYNCTMGTTPAQNTKHPKPNAQPPNSNTNWIWTSTPSPTCNTTVKNPNGPVQPGSSRSRYKFQMQDPGLKTTTPHHTTPHHPKCTNHLWYKLLVTAPPEFGQHTM